MEGGCGRLNIAQHHLLPLLALLTHLFPQQIGPRTTIPRIAAQYEGLNLEYVETNPHAEGGVGAAYLEKFPLGLVRDPFCFLPPVVMLTRLFHRSPASSTASSSSPRASPSPLTSPPLRTRPTSSARPRSRPLMSSAGRRGPTPTSSRTSSRGSRPSPARAPTRSPRSRLPRRRP